MTLKQILPNRTRKSVLGKSGIEYTQYYLNFYEGCSHGCLYPCYARVIKIKEYKEWLNPKPVINAPELLRKDIIRLKLDRKKPRDIMISTSTDPYQPINDIYNLTRKCIEVLIEYDLPFSILTKNARVLKDLDLFTRYWYNCRVGFTIITLDDEVRQRYEPFSSPIEERIKALEKLKEHKVKTWVSVEPLLPNINESNPYAIVSRLKDKVNKFVFGRLNHIKTKKYIDQYYARIVPLIKAHCKREGVKFDFKSELLKSLEHGDIQ